MAATAFLRTATACVLAMLPGLAFGLIYVLDPDDPSLPAEERVARLERRTARLEKLAADTRREGELIDQLIAEGKALEAGLKDKVVLFRSGRATNTAQAAFGEAGNRGLRWHCERASALKSRMAVLADEVPRFQRKYVAVLAETPLAAEGNDARLAMAIGELQSGLEASVDKFQPVPAVAQLKEVGEGLPFAWGAFTTLRQLAVQAETQVRDMAALSQRIDEGATRLDKPIAEHEAERGAIVGLARSMGPPAFSPAQLRRIDGVKATAERSHTTPIRQLPGSAYRDAAASWRERWTAAGKQASDTVYASIKPLHEAAAACGDADDPPRQFAQARRSAALSVLQAAAGIDQAGNARVAALDAERRKLDAALVKWRSVLQESLDKSSATWRQMEAAAPGSVRQVDLRQQFDRLSALKKQAQNAVEAIPQAQTGCQAESSALERLLPGLNQHTQALRALFPKEEG